MAAYGAHVVHVIEGNDSGDAGYRELQEMRDRFDGGLGEPSSGSALRDVQGRQRQGFQGWVLGPEGEDLGDRAFRQAGARFRAAGAHRVAL